MYILDHFIQTLDKPRARNCWTRVALGVVAFLLPGVANSQQATLVTGKEFRAALARPLNITWRDVPWRQGAYDLGQTRRLAVMVDRRLDSAQPVALELAGVPLEQIFQHLARVNASGVSVLDGVVYLGPQETARTLRTVLALRAGETGRLPPSARRVWLKRAALSWPQLATPREILDELARSGGVTLHGLDQVPHDLWPALALPPLTLIDRLSLVLAGLGLTFELEDSGRAARLVPWPAECAIEKSYPAGREPAKLIARYAQLAPEAALRQQGNQIVVRGRVEDHEAITAPRKANDDLATGPTDLDRLRIDRMAFEKIPLDEVLKQLARRLGLELVLDRPQATSAGVDLSRLVSVRIEQATVNQALAAVLVDSGLSFRRVGRRVEIVVAARSRAGTPAK